MKPLERRLEAARAEYAASRYPGNLAADLEARPARAPRRGRWLVRAAIAAGLAIVALLLSQRPSPPPTTGFGISVAAPGGLPSLSFPSLPALPSPAGLGSAPSLSLPSVPLRIELSPQPSTSENAS